MIHIYCVYVRPPLHNLIKMKYIKYILGISLIFSSIQFMANQKVSPTLHMTNTNLTESLEKGFDEIIRYHKDKGELHQRTERDVRFFVSYLLKQTDNTKLRLEDVIKKINYETIKSDGQYKVWPELEFWRGVDDFGSSVALNYDGGVDILDDEEPVVIGRYDNLKTPSDTERLRISKDRSSVKIDIEKYPISQIGYYEYRFNETALFYAWIAYLWQEVEGYKCGIKTKTIQNNSINTFSLNDFLDGDFSSFVESDYGEKPPRLANFFPRKLSLIELYLRATQTGYPFNPYKNYWRYFEKGNQFTEIVHYEFSTGIRTGKLLEKKSAEVNQIIKHDNSKASLKYITDFTNQMIFEGWEEKLRPIGMPTSMHPDAYDFEIWTGIHWTKEQSNILPKAALKAFEDKHGIDLPNSFFHYLRLLDGRQYNSHNMYFPINDLYTIKVKKFHTLVELNKLAATTITKDPNNLWIGELQNEKKLGIVIDTQSENYGRIVLDENGEIEICDYTFEKFAKYSQGSPTQPEIFAAEENDADFLSKRISEGWDYNTSYSYQNAVTQAAENNAHEALEILMEAGARLRHNKHREMPHTYDKKTMEILDKYQKD